ncbi:MAG: substrate-binding domain-containing protein, partial [Aeromicrobium sp.]|uniref:substrate-binding domain-containing protein n=1 Tax=Aeromicrobium sp. TaxID=1871063 RepID=UPI003C65C87B
MTALALALSLGACAAVNERPGYAGDVAGSSLSGRLNGAGSSAQEAAVNAWKAGIQTANPNLTVNYDPAGSGAGREQFIAGGVAFAGSDAYLTDEELEAASKRCGGDVVEIPTYVSPIAVIFNLEGVDELK